MRRLFFLAACLLFLTSCISMGGPDQSQMGRKANEAVRAGQAGPDKTNPYFSNELDKNIIAQLKEMEGRDQQVPITLNEDVKAEVQYLLTEAPKFMKGALGRSTRYLPMMQKILREKGLPEDLAYMVLIESGFKVHAVSHAQAVGPWQFISSTGRRYGLRINEFVDERRHPVLATKAASEYLADLYEMFGCWQLAAAAYNCGEGKILEGLKKYDAESFWDIADQNFLRDETKRYVPRLLAAIIIAKDPDRFGLTGIEYDKPIEYDEVVVTQPTDLAVVARLTGTSVDEIEDLNPHLKLWSTPLTEHNYTIYVPKGAGHGFDQKYAQLKPEERMRMSVHVVQSGETLKSIAKRFGLTASTLKSFNGLKSIRLRKGQKLNLPVDKNVYAARQQRYAGANQAAELQKVGNQIEYTVRPGDNPWLIARRFDLHWKDIAAWNDIKDVKKIKPGRKLVLFLDEETNTLRNQAKRQNNKPSVTQAAAASTDKPTIIPATYKVQSGDTLWRIALKFKIKPDEIRTLNGIEGTRISTGQVLKLQGEPVQTTNVLNPKISQGSCQPVKPAPASAESKPPRAGAQTYTVKSGDTLWKIAQAFKVSPDDIKAVNGLKDSFLKVGQVLKLPAVAQADRAASEPAVAAQKSEPAESAPTPATEKKVVSYKVKSGDTVWKIAMLFKVKPDQIRTWNEMKSDRLRPGDVLTIKKDKS